MMNMHKLGIVSHPEQLFNNSTKSSAIKYLRLMRYTLCVYYIDFSPNLPFVERLCRRTSNIDQQFFDSSSSLRYIKH
jgi:hypothetical protein